MIMASNYGYPFYLRAEPTGFRTPSPLSIEFEFMEIIYHFAASLQFNRILEIGTADGHSTWWFGILGCEVTTVDPACNQKSVPPEVKELTSITFEPMTSDEFFLSRNNGKKWDLILVDGDHEYEQAKRDIQNSLEVLAPGGMIFVHDTVCFRNSVERAVLDFWEVGPWVHLPLGKGLSYVRP